MHTFLLSYTEETLSNATLKKERKLSFRLQHVSLGEQPVT